MTDSNLLHGDRFKAEFEGWRVGLEAEVVVLPIDELGIGDEAVFVPAFGLPERFEFSRKGAKPPSSEGLGTFAALRLCVRPLQGLSPKHYRPLRTKDKCCEWGVL